MILTRIPVQLRLRTSPDRWRSSAADAGKPWSAHQSARMGSASRSSRQASASERAGFSRENSKASMRTTRSHTSH